MKELIIITIILSTISIGIIYETNKSVEALTKKLNTPHSKLETKN